MRRPAVVLIIRSPSCRRRPRRRRAGAMRSPEETPRSRCDSTVPASISKASIVGLDRWRRHRCWLRPVCVAGGRAPHGLGRPRPRPSDRVGPAPAVVPDDGNAHGTLEISTRFSAPLGSAPGLARAGSRPSCAARRQLVARFGRSGRGIGRAAPRPRSGPRSGDAAPAQRRGLDDPATSGGSCRSHRQRRLSGRSAAVDDDRPLRRRRHLPDAGRPGRPAARNAGEHGGRKLSGAPSASGLFAAPSNK